MRILLIGAAGQLGTDLVAAFRKRSNEVYTPTHTELDVRDFRKLQEAMSKKQPELVVSTAAFHRVEECEQQPLLAFDVNAVGSANLARAPERADRAAASGCWLPQNTA